jgi:hypothetical protein
VGDRAQLAGEAELAEARQRAVAAGAAERDLA